VEDGAAATSPADEIDGGIEAGFWEGGGIVVAAFPGGGGVEQGEIDFQPGILVASYDDAGPICVEEEYGGICGRGLQEMVLN
jgi:hypothetical protein